MKIAGYILVACLMVSVLQAAMGVLILALPIILLASLIKYPRETIGLVALLLIGGLIQHRPGTMVSILGVVLVACLTGKVIDKIAR